MTRDTCIFSHTNEMSPCFPTHPCALIKHNKRTRAIIVKCFWHLARPYCEQNQKNVGALVPLDTPKKKNNEKNRKEKKNSPQTTVTAIDGQMLQPTIKIAPQEQNEQKKETEQKTEKQEKNDDTDEDKKEEQEEKDAVRELKEEQDLEQKEDDEKEEEEEEEAEGRSTPHDPYDAEDFEEYDEACSHVLRDSFVDAIRYFESKGLYPELEENEKKKIEDEKKLQKVNEERRKHKFMPKQDTQESKEADERSVAAQEKEDQLMALLPPADPLVHSLLTKKSSKLKVVGGLKSKLKQWYVKHGMGEKALDEGHMNALAKKYLKHEDLLFTRLHVKYHQTKD